MAPGDRLRLFTHEDRLLVLVQESRPASIPSRVEKSPWTRYRSLGDLRSLVAERFPGFSLRDFEVLRRGVSGRVGEMRLDGENGESFVIEGLAVRWTLGLPDTLFSASRRGPAESGGWLFSGRGRGHGVGLCQTGAFGMGLRGQSYREILEHYYSGVELIEAVAGSEVATR
jgi:stage II sporulation protein D